MFGKVLKFFRNFYWNDRNENKRSPIRMSDRIWQLITVINEKKTVAL